MRSPIYLDYAATTPVDPRVADCMGRFLTRHGTFGNPASRSHGFGKQAAQAVTEARAQVAVLVSADPGEIVWTSGATESNNLAIKGAALANLDRGRHIITSKTEHRAVLDPCAQLARNGFEVTYVDVGESGLVDIGELEATLRADTVLVSIMHVNNEIGVIQDLEKLAAMTRSRGVLLHVDAAQSAGKVPIDLSAWPVDLMSFSAHKVYGPKGIGALYVRHTPRVRVRTQIHGGGQERGLRGGTLPTHQIAAMGAAFEIAHREGAAESTRIRGLRDRLWRGLQSLGSIYLNGDPEQHVAGILNVSFAGVERESLIAALDDVAISAGSACSSSGFEPSHVMRALRYDEERARTAVRFSIGRFTIREEIDHTIFAARRAVRRLRAMSPLWEAQTGRAGVGNVAPASASEARV